MSKRIVIIGTSSVGKSTVFELLRKDSRTSGFNFIEEAARKLDIRVTEATDMLKLQYTIRSMHAELEDEFFRDGYIADRCVLDSFIYFNKLCGPLVLPQELREYELFAMQAISKYTHIIYIPIQYPLINDGFRFTNDTFRHEIDYEIKNFLYTHEIPYHTVTGKPNARLEQICDIIGE